MGWRKDLTEKVVVELKTIPELITVKIFNEDIAEGIAKGRIPRSPFALVQYTGFSSEPLGEDVQREINISVLFGVCGLRGEQSAFKGDDAPTNFFTMEQLLEDFEDHFWGLDLGFGCNTIVGDEAYVGMLEGGILVFSDELIIKAIFKKG